MTTIGVYHEQERIYAEEIERGVDSEVMADIGFQPLEPPADSPADMLARGAVAQEVEAGAMIEGTASPEDTTTFAAEDDSQWKHEAYAAYLLHREGDNPPRPKTRRPDKARRRLRLTGRARIIADGRGTDPDLM